MSWARLRRQVFERDGGYCRACGARVGKRWDVDHLQARVRGGLDELDNLVLMHPRCNRIKPLTATRGEALGWMVRQRMQTPVDWQASWELTSGKAQQDGTQTLAEHERLE